jgi:hypothetical protein
VRSSDAGPFGQFDHQRNQDDERSDTGADREHEAKRNARDDGGDQGPAAMSDRR